MLKRGKTIAISLLLGLLAAAGFYAYTSGLAPFGRKPTAEESVKIQTQPVVTAKFDMPRRTLITEDMVEVVEIPVGFARQDALSDVGSAVGRVTTDRILAGEIVPAAKIRAADSPSELSFVVPEGKRAITIGANIISAVGNMIKPGDLVDVIAYLDKDAAGEDVSFTLLRGMMVLATDVDIYGGEKKDDATKKLSKDKYEEYKSVTLAATPAECVSLNLAESVGRLKLALHSTLDTRETGAAAASIRDLRGIAGLKEIPDIKKKEEPARTPSDRPATKETAVKISSLPLPPVRTTTTKQDNVRNVHIIRGTDVDVVSAMVAGATDHAKRGETK